MWYLVSHIPSARPALVASRPLWSYGADVKQLRVGKHKERVIVVRVVQPAEVELVITRRDVRHMAVMLGLL